MVKKIGIIDYDCGNIYSLTNALKRIHHQKSVICTGDIQELECCDLLFLPGVSSAKHCMDNLKKRSLDSFLYSAIKSHIPVVGICVGMQVLFEVSEESNDDSTQTACLGVLKGKVKLFEMSNEQRKQGYTIPHMGWNYVNFSSESILGQGLDSVAYFYFVHSYHCQADDEQTVVAKTKYLKEFHSVVLRDNVCGLQFHPEKSASNGLLLLQNLVRYYLG